ncbi:putative RecB family exonuclease [Streptomyces sp. SLBN-8D4]
MGHCQWRAVWSVVMETSTEGVTEAAADDAGTPEAVIAAQAGTAGAPEAVTAAQAGTAGTPEAVIAAQAGTAGAPEAAGPGTAPTTVADGQRGAAPADEDPGPSEAADAAQSVTGDASNPAEPGTAPTAIAHGRQGGDAAGAGEATGSPVGGAVSKAAAVVPVAPASLSPSRANDFMQCPLLYRFRVIDRLPEKPSAAATRGTLVHSVLERLFDAPAGERTAPAAKSLIPGQWDRLRESRPEVVELFADDPDGERLAQWLGEAERLVERWFTLEDPTRLEPAERELFVEAELDSGLRLRGIIDRVDVAPTGEVRIVDYKTGKAPRPEYAEGALFQMKFYALVVWRLKNVIPRRLQLVYLGSGDVLTYDPVRADLERVERKLLALWEAIRQATQSGDWRPRPTKLCGWCDHQEHCPEFGGTPPPYPLPVTPAISEQGRMGPD